MQDLIKLAYGTEQELRVNLRQRELGVATDRNLKPFVGRGNGQMTGLATDLEFSQLSETITERVNQTLSDSGLVDLEFGVRLSALNLAIDMVNRKIIQGSATINGAPNNGYFTSTPASVSVLIPSNSRIVNNNYSVRIMPTSGDISGAGTIVVYDKMVNGFKVQMSGSAKSLTFDWMIVKN